MAKKKHHRKAGKKARKRPTDPRTGKFLSNAAIARRRSAKKASRRPHRPVRARKRRRNPVVNPLPNPVRRRKPRRRAAVRPAAPATIIIARESVKENPMAKKRKKAKAKASTAPKRRRKSRRAKKSGTHPKRPHTTAIVRGRTVKRRRTKGGKVHTSSKPANISIRIGQTSSRKAAKRSSPKRKRGKKRGYSYTPRGRHGKSRTASLARSVARRQSSVTATASENPFGMETTVFENPMGGGEMLFALGTAVVGFTLGDVVSRYMAIRNQPTANAATLAAAKPSLMSLGAEVLVGAGLLWGSSRLRGSFGRASVQGLGYGVLLNALSKVVSHWIMEPLLGKTATGAAMYAPEIAADAAAAQLTGATGAGASAASGATGAQNTSASGSTGATAGDTGATGQQGTSGPRSPYPVGRRFDPGPRAYGMGQDPGQFVPNPSPLPPQYVPGAGGGGQTIFGGGNPPQNYQPPIPQGGPCVPCGAQSTSTTDAQAYQTARMDAGMNGMGSPTIHTMFPD